jgi:hypothetical protein
MNASSIDAARDLLHRRSFLIGGFMDAASSSAGSVVAVGGFAVKIGSPDLIAVPEGASPVGRHLEGGLHGRAVGEMLTSGQPRAGEELRASITPGSGTGELSRIRRERLIRHEAGKHYYTLNYVIE